MSPPLMSTQCWEDVSLKRKNEIKTNIQDILMHVAGYCDIIFFPIRHETQLRKCHWTLMWMDKKQEKFIHYNSLGEQVINGVDISYEDAITYVSIRRYLF